MKSQVTDTVIMVRPDSFGFDPETAATNAFQHKPTESQTAVRLHAIVEFEAAVKTLSDHHINVIVIPSPKGVIVPDAVFPNNWVSFMSGGVMVVYPMLAPARRRERQATAFKKALEGTIRFSEEKIIDFTKHETEGKFLEGTGSLVLDRVHEVAFAIVSARTHETLVREWANVCGYTPVIFHAYGKKDHLPIYHTNVLMNIGDGFCVICLDAIADSSERKRVSGMLKKLQLEIIAISLNQLHAYCGNVLEVRSADGKSYIVLSQTAFDAFSGKQKSVLEKYGTLLPISIPTIEQVGGGSARCMLAEVFV